MWTRENTFVLKKKFPNQTLIGIEPSKEMISKSDVSELILLSNAEDMIFEKEYFDLIISRFIFKWFKDKSKVLNKINNYLKKEGYFLLWDSGENEIIEIVDDLIEAFRINNFNTSKVEAYFKKYRIPLNEVNHLVYEANFEIEDCGELYLEEKFTSVDEFIHKWLIGFGVVYELSTILSRNIHEIIKIISNYLEIKYGSHHNYYFVCKRL